MKLTMAPASGTTVGVHAGGVPLTQAIRVENAQQGAKPSECGGRGRGPVQRRRGGVARARAARSVLNRVAATHTLALLAHPCPASPRAVALKLRLTYTPPGGGEAVTETTDVKNFPPTL